jgi:general stress protein YciG
MTRARAARRGFSLAQPGATLYSPGQRYPQWRGETVRGEGGLSSPRAQAMAAGASARSVEDAPRDGEAQATSRGPAGSAAALAEAEEKASEAARRGGQGPQGPVAASRSSAGRESVDARLHVRWHQEELKAPSEERPGLLELNQSFEAAASPLPRSVSMDMAAPTGFIFEYHRRKWRGKAAAYDELRDGVHVRVLDLQLPIEDTHAGALSIRGGAQRRQHRQSHGWVFLDERELRHFGSLVRWCRRFLGDSGLKFHVWHDPAEAQFDFQAMRQVGELQLQRIDVLLKRGWPEDPLQDVWFDAELEP